LDRQPTLYVDHKHAASYKQIQNIYTAKVIYITKTLGTPQYKHDSSHKYCTTSHGTFVHTVTISNNKNG